VADNSTQAYKVTSTKDPFDGTTQVLVEGESVDAPDAKVAEVGGDPVELTEAQVGVLKERFNVRTVDEDTAQKAAEEASNDDSSEVRGEGGAVSVEASSGGGGNPRSGASRSR
jgi:hypothetical protein